MKVKFPFLRRSLFFILIFFCSTIIVIAQTRQVRLNIKNRESAQPMQGVSISVKGAAANAVTDAAGNAVVTVPSAQSVLLITYVGFGTQEIVVGNRSSIDISMSASATTLDDIVVIGYGTVKRRDLTGAVSSIKAEEIVKTPTHNALEAMQGRVSGVDITRSSGAAGAGSNILIRGTRSLSGDNSPLYIIDGYQGGNISDLNPNDIESIDILKDASSTAIYGSQGANGVIIVTTKKGAAGKLTVSYDGFYGVNGYTSFPEPRLRADYIQLRREAFRTSGQWSSPADDPKLFPNADEWAAVQAGQWVNWFDELNQNGTQQSHTVTVRSGSDKTKVFLSLGYFNEEGMLRRNDFKRYTVRFNLDQTLASWAKAGVLSQLTYTDLNSRRDPLSTALSRVPLGVPYDSAGNINVYPLNNNPQLLSPLTDERGDLIARR